MPFSSSSRPAPRFPPRRTNRIRSDGHCGIPPRFFLVGFNLGATIPWIAITFVAFVNLVALTTIGIVPSRRRPVSRHVRYGSRDGKYDGFGRQADSRRRDGKYYPVSDCVMRRIDESGNAPAAIPDCINDECVYERPINSHRFRTVLLKEHLPIRLHSMPSAYNICWLIVQHAMHMPPPM